MTLVFSPKLAHQEADFQKVATLSYLPPSKPQSENNSSACLYQTFLTEISLMGPCENYSRGSPWSQTSLFPLMKLSKSWAHLANSHME